MRFSVNQNLNKVQEKKINLPLRLRGGTNGGHKGPLLGSDGGENENKKREDYFLPIFFATTILGIFVLEFSFSYKEGVKVKAHASVKN